MKRLATVLLILNMFAWASGQKKPGPWAKWYIKPAIGYNIPLSTFPSAGITDYLIEYDDHSYYWQLLSVNWFFSPRWGLEITYQPGRSGDIAGYAGKFSKEIENRYNNGYYVNVGSGGAYAAESGIDRGYIGLVYRIEKTRYIIMPRFMIGSTSFYANWGNAVLKEKGTNNVFEIHYDPDEIPQDQFTIAPSVTMGYRLSRRFIINLDVMYSCFRTNFAYTEELRNNFTGETTSEIFEYRKYMHTLSVGAGLIVVFKPGPPKVSPVEEDDGYFDRY